ncbi:hypothetical protein [Streptomyces sp. NPDC058305]|uniref:hypothetical protein n=1 Tax=Streptomyces sp. NPDC058305 TaxID=3346438 RepID=UPI0036E052D7
MQVLGLGQDVARGGPGRRHGPRQAGAQAFGGFYTEGTVLDPVDLSVALSDDAQLPDGDGDGGSGNGSGTGGSGDSGTTSGTTGGGGTTGSTTGGVTGALASTGSDVPTGALGAAGAGVVIAVRRRRQA